MGEYLSPGVYIEEIEMGAKPIEGVSTSTAGFVGVTGLLQEFPAFPASFTLLEENIILPSSPNGPILSEITALSDLLKKELKTTDDYSNFSDKVDAAIATIETADATNLVSENDWLEINETATTAKYKVRKFGEENTNAFLANDLPSNDDIQNEIDDLKSVLEINLSTGNDYSNFSNNVDATVVAIKTKADSLTGAEKTQALEDLSTIKEIANAAKLKVKHIKSRIDEEIALYVTYKDKPTFISSWGDYVSKFGRYTEGNYLAPTVYSFFANGGKHCYVVIVEDATQDNIIGTVNADKSRTGLRAFEEVDEVNILCIPGITNDDDIDTIQKAMITHCETMGDRFCIFDSNKGENFSEIQTRKGNLISDKGIGALYYPWIKTAVEKKNTEGKVVLENMFIPPSGAMAGIYARSDTERGVHKAPANEVVRGVLELERTITKAEQDILNPKNINCIRAFQGRGIRVWGARTIAPKGSEWKYINVRRLFLFLEESIDESTQWVVFEPNNEALWARVVQTISNFLLGVWKSGALMGKKPEKAFFVKCDRSTMTDDDIANGRLIILIGIAPTKPAEFVIFKIGQWTADANN